MKQTKIFALTIILVAMLAILTNSITSVWAYSPTQKIIVRGVSEISVKPDCATICVGVETSNESLTDAQKENAETMKGVIETLMANGIERDNIKTTSFNIFKQQYYNTSNEVSLSQVSHRICFKTTNLTQIDELLTKLTESGANVFDGITFELCDSSPAYNQALKQAIQNAKNKINILAPNTTMEVMEILEESSYCSPYYLNSCAKAELSNNIMQNDVSVGACVKVVFKCTTTPIVGTNENINTTTSQQNLNNNI